MTTQQQVLQACTVKGQVVILPPGQLDRSLYQQVAKALELIGGKWTRKEGGFLFQEDPAPLLQQVAGGKKVNLQKEYQFFATSASLARMAVGYLGLEEYDMVLEPSAGQGALIKAVHDIMPKLTVNYCELMPLNRTFLAKLPNVNYLTDNFLKLPTNRLMRGMFHKIIANPPFSKNQDVDHIKAMYEVCAPGGRIVTFASKHWKFANNNKEKDFRKWLNTLDYGEIDIPEGEYSESGTNISTVLLTINK